VIILAPSTDLDITYREKRLTDLDIDPTDEADFKSVYKLELTSLWSRTHPLFIVANCLVFIVVIIRIYIWNRHNPSINYDQKKHKSKMILTFVVLYISTWANIFFYYMIIMTGVWYGEYKLNNDVEILLPDEDDSDVYVEFKIVFGVLVSF